MTSNDKRQSAQSDHVTNASLLSLGSESVITASSTTPLNPRAQRPKKDYEAALGVLQSRYGMGGDIPSPKKTPSRKLPEVNQQADGSVATPPSTPSPTEDSSSSTLRTTSRSSDGSFGEGKAKKKRFSFLRVFQERKKKELEAKEGLGEGASTGQIEGNEG